jgi:hypothetical protein
MLIRLRMVVGATVVVESRYKREKTGGGSAASAWRETTITRAGAILHSLSRSLSESRSPLKSLLSTDRCLFCQEGLTSGPHGGSCCRPRPCASPR